MTNEIKDLCIRFFEGRTDESEDMVVMDFRASDTRTFHEWEKEWKAGASKNFEKCFGFENVRRRIRCRLVARWSARAAAFAACIVAAVMLIPGKSGTEAVETMLCEATQSCEKKTVTLPDGTKVFMNALSTLTYGDGFGITNRNISMTGEAYFDVAPDKTLPFVLATPEGCITVLGTRFSVSSYAKQKTFSAVLEKGSISFDTEGCSMMLVPGEVLSIDKLSGTVTRSRTDVEKSLYWMKGRIEYDSILLDDLFDRISSIYGVEIVNNATALSSTKFGILLSDSNSVSDIFAAISHVVPVSYEINDGRIVVYEKK